MFSNSSEEGNEKLIKISEIKEVSEDKGGQAYIKFHADLELKKINRENFKVYSLYRDLWNEYFKSLGLFYLAKRIEEYKADSDDELDDLFNLLTSLGYSETLEVRRNDNEMRSLSNEVFEIKKGFKKKYLIKIFKPVNVEKITYIYDTHIQYEENEYDEYYEIKFTVDIPKNINLKIKDEIIIVANKQTLRYKVCLEAKKSEVDLNKYAVIYDFLKNDENEVEFKEKFQKDIVANLEENKDYHMSSLVEIAKRISKKYNWDAYEVFRWILDKENKKPINLVQNKDSRLKVSIFKKITRVFTRKKNQGFLGIQKYIESNKFDIDEINKSRSLNQDYYDFRYNLIANLNGQNIEKDLSFIFTKNSYEFLCNVRIPKEFYFYILKNLDMLNLDDASRSDIKNKVKDMLLNDFSFTVEKKALEECAKLVFKQTNQSLVFIETKINALTRICQNTNSEIFYIKNKDLRGKYLVDLYLDRGLNNYVLLPKGECELVSVKNSSEVLSVKNRNDHSRFKSVEVLKIDTVCRYLVVHNILKEYVEKSLKIDDYFKDIAIYQSFSFEDEINSVENIPVNSTIDKKFKAFDNSISKEKIVFIKNLETKEEVLNIVQIVNSTDSTLIIMALMERVNTLKIREVSIAILIEAIIKDKPFIDTNIKRVLAYQYNSGVFTENSAEAVRLLAYTDKSFEKYLIDMKIKNNELDTKLCELVNQRAQSSNDRWDLDRAYIIYNKARVQTGIIDFNFYSDISILNHCLVNGSKQDNALKNELPISSKNRLLEYYGFKKSINEKEYKLAIDIIGSSAELDVDSVTKFLEMFYTKEITFKSFDEFSMLKRYLWKSDSGKSKYINIISQIFKCELDISSIEIALYLDESDVSKFEEFIFNRELNRKDECETIKLFYKICIKQKEKNKLALLNEHVTKYLDTDTIKDIIKDISYVSIKAAIDLLIYIDEEVCYQEIDLIWTILKNLQKDLKVDLKVVLELLSIINKYHSSQNELILECLKYTLKYEEIEYTDYKFIICESLDYLDDKIKVDFINSRRYKNQCYYYLLYNYKQLFIDNNEIINILEQRYLDGYIDSSDIKGKLLEKYYRNDSMFLEISNRLYTSARIEELIEEKAKEKFSQDIHYVECLINSNVLGDNMKFIELREHINKKLTNYYNHSYVGNLELIKSSKTDLIKHQKYVDIFTKKQTNIVSVDSDILEYELKTHFLEYNKVFKLVKGKVYEFNLTENLAGNQSDNLIQCLEKIKRFIELILKLYKKDIFIDKSVRIYEYEETVFLEPCLFTEKIISECLYTELIKNRILKILEVKEEYKELDELKESIMNPIKNGHVLEDIQSAIDDALIILKFERLSFVEKVENFAKFDLAKKELIIDEILIENTTNSKGLKIVIANIKQLENDEKTLKYLIKRFAMESNLTNDDCRKIFNFISRYDRSAFSNISKKDKDKFIEVAMKKNINNDLIEKVAYKLKEKNNDYIEGKSNQVINNEDSFEEESIVTSIEAKKSIEDLSGDKEKFDKKQRTIKKESVCTDIEEKIAITDTIEEK